jgi:hypothetical protein
MDKNKSAITIFIAVFLIFRGKKQRKKYPFSQKKQGK